MCTYVRCDVLYGERGERLLFRNAPAKRNHAGVVSPFFRRSRSGAPNRSNICAAIIIVIIVLVTLTRVNFYAFRSVTVARFYRDGENEIKSDSEENRAV